MQSRRLRNKSGRAASRVCVPRRADGQVSAPRTGPRLGLGRPTNFPEETPSMMNPPASQDLWQSPGYRRGPPSVRRLPGLCTSTIDDHSRLGFMLSFAHCKTSAASCNPSTTGKITVSPIAYWLACRISSSRDGSGANCPRVIAWTVSTIAAFTGV